MRFSRSFLVIAAVTLSTLTAGLLQAASPNFTGTWTLSPAKSENLGMMAAVKQTLVITQNPKELVVKETSDFNGSVTDRTVRYDLSGKPVNNEGAMGGVNETIAKWDGDKLIVTWTAEGSVAGTKSVRTETRSLGADGKTMSVQSVRGSNKPLVMVFEKSK